MELLLVKPDGCVYVRHINDRGALAGTAGEHEAPLQVLLPLPLLLRLYSALSVLEKSMLVAPAMMGGGGRRSGRSSGSGSGLCSPEMARSLKKCVPEHFESSILQNLRLPRSLNAAAVRVGR